MNTIIVKNATKHNFCFSRDMGKSQVIKPGASIPISENELILLANGRTFSGGFLKIVNKDAIPEHIRYLFEVEGSILELDEEDVKSKISGRMGDFYNYMNEIQERNESSEKRFVFQVAKDMDDLNLKKAKKIEEVTGMKFDFVIDEE